MLSSFSFPISLEKIEQVLNSLITKLTSQNISTRVLQEVLRFQDSYMNPYKVIWIEHFGEDWISKSGFVVVSLGFVRIPLVYSTVLRFCEDSLIIIWIESLVTLDSWPTKWIEHFQGQIQNHGSSQIQGFIK
jgi:hypothetical protein